LASAIYAGTVRHRRYEPIEHRFSNRLFMMYLDLNELDQVFGRNLLWSQRNPAPAWFRRSDYLGHRDRPLAEAVSDVLYEATGRRPAGPIRLLTHLRYFGYCFNPVSFYYCFDASGEHLDAVVAEITNTPWKERHAYILDRGRGDENGELLRRSFAKEFHVSPFWDKDHTYKWSLTRPTESLSVHMENHRQGRKVFDATMKMHREEISGAALTRVLLRFPFMTLKVIGAIHLQALRLKLKGAVFHPHPEKVEDRAETRTR
jgi:DUF1365 family protein